MEKIYTDSDERTFNVDVRDIYLTIDYVSGIIPDPDASKAYTNNVRLPRLLDKICEKSSACAPLRYLYR